jgi:alpha-D-ribose 1-methylphosphonate 5-triphosphate diphosphatase PhnM
MEVTRDKIIQALDDLSDNRLDEVFNFVMLIKHSDLRKVQDEKENNVKVISVEELISLSGLIDFGGDALEDTEKLYS